MALISANDARELVQNSDVELEKNLTYVSSKITDTANAGKRELFLDREYGEKFRFFQHSQYSRPTLTPPQQRMVDALKSKGYAVEFVQRTYQVGGGLGSMGEDPHDETQWHLQVKW